MKNVIAVVVTMLFVLMSSGIAKAEPCDRNALLLSGADKEKIEEACKPQKPDTEKDKAPKPAGKAGGAPKAAKPTTTQAGSLSADDIRKLIQEEVKKGGGGGLGWAFDEKHIGQTMAIVVFVMIIAFFVYLKRSRIARCFELADENRLMARDLIRLRREVDNLNLLVNPPPVQPPPGTQPGPPGGGPSVT